MLRQVKEKGEGWEERSLHPYVPPHPLFSPYHLPQGMIFLLFLIFLSHKIKDGGQRIYEHKQVTHSPKNMPAMQDIIVSLVVCVIYVVNIT